MISDIPAEQIRAALESVAFALLGEADVTAPPVHAAHLASRLGLLVANDSGASTRARFVRLCGDSAVIQPTILLADDPRAERRHWAIAHEVGEAHAHEVFTLLDADPRDAPTSAREAVANLLAGCLLLPRPWFANAGLACDWDLFDLKTTFETASHELIARRMLEMPPAVILTLWDQNRLQWRRGNTGGRTPPMTPPEQAVRRAAYDSSHPARCDAAELPEGVDNVRAWPVHEPGWKREIVRTQLTAWE